MAKGWSFDSLVKALKGGAFLDVGKTKETVAAGDDSRIVNALQKGNNLSDITDALLARRNIGAYANRGSIDDKDLNGLFGQKESGVWYQHTHENATSARHYPVETAGRLVVLPGVAFGPNASTQLYYSYKNPDVFYMRVMDRDWQWSEWSHFESSNVLRPLITTAQNTANNANTNANGRVPNTRKVNGKALSADITLNAGDVGASTPAQVNEAKTMATNAQNTANSAVTKANTAQTTANNANTNANGRVPNTRKVNGKQLNADITLNAGDVGAGLKSTADRSANGWWKCGDTGIIYQWGTKTIAYGDYFINFPIAFPNKLFHFSAIDSEGANNPGFSLTNSTLSKVAMEMPAPVIQVMWFAIGF